MRGQLVLRSGTGASFDYRPTTSAYMRAKSRAVAGSVLIGSDIDRERRAASLPGAAASYARALAAPWATGPARHLFPKSPCLSSRRFALAISFRPFGVL